MTVKRLVSYYRQVCYQTVISTRKFEIFIQALCNVMEGQPCVTGPTSARQCCIFKSGVEQQL
jgi:hypothetical protein